MPYPEKINLPFNFAYIKDTFELRPPSAHDSGEQGTWAVIQGNSVVLIQDKNGLTLPQGGLPAGLPPKTTPVCIGLWHGKPLRAIFISTKLTLPPPFVAEPFNAGEERMDMQTLTLAGLAKQILHWEQQSRYCSACGAQTERVSATWGKKCSECGTEHFPHIHPCAIVLVKRGNELLLTRKAEWPAGRYSLVAGFLDFGESLEECAIREVREETGIEIENVRYVGSQNWPFPAQLMAGFVADYAGGEIVVDQNELEDARWFPLDALPILPPSRSIARWIIDNFK
ncbi:MAG: NADH pyrophosphatase [Desulfuromonadaceae bacterium GWB2_53_15]|nr:MAG: NADH pyrophosphatase [Desulfuromonadales bacterium GWD2_54_10]OHB30468.1 MAG: NADH pyrophosphatase [Desulfuromonadaceae bacterium GWB2_53_15]